MHHQKLNFNKILKEKTNIKDIEGVFLTHAHIGHYTGLMYYGNEAAGSRDLKFMQCLK